MKDSIFAQNLDDGEYLMFSTLRNTLWKSTINRDHDFLEKKSTFFRQINAFTKEETKELADFTKFFKRDHRVEICKFFPMGPHDILRKFRQINFFTKLKS